MSAMDIENKDKALCDNDDENWTWEDIADRIENENRRMNEEAVEKSEEEPEIQHPPAKPQQSENDDVVDEEKCDEKDLCDEDIYFNPKVHAADRPVYFVDVIYMETEPAEIAVLGPDMETIYHRVLKVDELSLDKQRVYKTKRYLGWDDKHQKIYYNVNDLSVFFKFVPCNSLFVIGGKSCHFINRTIKAMQREQGDKKGRLLLWKVMTSQAPLNIKQVCKSHSSSAKACALYNVVRMVKYYNYYRDVMLKY